MPVAKPRAGEEEPMTRPMQRDVQTPIPASNVAAWPTDLAGGPASTTLPRRVLFPNIRSDLEAHGGRWGSQGFWALMVYRFGRWRYGVRPAPLRKAFSAIYHVLF